MKRLLVGCAVLLCAVTLAWATGRTRPMVVVERTVTTTAPRPCPLCYGTRTIACAHCNGSGQLAAAKIRCPQCNATGKVDGGSQLRRTHPERRLGAPVSCPLCGGTGQVEGGRTPCPDCRGKGRVVCPVCGGTGVDPDSTQARFRTVREDLSRWERWTDWIRFGPPDDRPTVRANGSVPLVERFLELYRSPRRDLRVMRWGALEYASNTWSVTALLQIRDAGVAREEWRRFQIRQREIVHVELLSPTSPAKSIASGDAEFCTVAVGEHPIPSPEVP